MKGILKQAEHKSMTSSYQGLEGIGHRAGLGSGPRRNLLDDLLTELGSWTSRYPFPFGLFTARMGVLNKLEVRIRSSLSNKTWILVQSPPAPSSFK